MAEITQYFFEINRDALNQLQHYAPNDAQLLNIPFHMMATDPFLLAFNAPSIQDPRKGALLFSYLRSINTTLAKTLASYRFITTNYNKQLIHNHDVIIHSEILNIYRSSSRDFITNLKIAVDQMILTLATKRGIKTKCDCIGHFLNQLEQYEKFQCLAYFLVKLNTAANYLKHHVEQFESFEEIHFIGLRIRVTVSSSSYSKDAYKKICDYLSEHKIIEETEEQVVYYLALDALIPEFNKFTEFFLTELTTVSSDELEP